MLKKHFIFSLILALIITLVPLFSAAPSQAAPNIDLPEQAGIYNVPENPHLKLRVFVHAANNQNHGKPTSPKGKPTPPPPSETCRPTSTTDPDSLAVIAGAGWILPAEWTYHLNLNSVPTTVGSTNLAAVTDNAFNAWLSVPTVNQSVNIVRGNDTAVAKAQFDSSNIIAWGRAPGSALAISYIWYEDGIATEIDTIMNQKYTWYWSNPANWATGQTCAYSGVYDAQNILTHELGHTIGLDDEYTGAHVNNTMYGYGSTGETKKNTLTTGDKTGVENLY